MEKYLDYLTEKDLIKRYSDKREIPYEEIEDLYKAFKKWILYKLNDTSLSPKAGYVFHKFISVLHKNLIVEDLKRGNTNPKYKRAEEQLRYYLSGKQKLNID